MTVTALGEGSLVVVHCANPKDKLWGVVQRLDAVGLVLRGLDLNSVEDWMRQEAGGGERLIGPSTVFIPMHRVERIYLDERAGAVESFAERFRGMTGRDAAEVLGETP